MKNYPKFADRKGTLKGQTSLSKIEKDMIFTFLNSGMRYMYKGFVEGFYFYESAFGIEYSTKNDSQILVISP